MWAIAGCGRFLLPKFRSKSYSLIGLISERNITTSPSSSSSHGPLLQKLLKEPISRIKATLESEFNSRSEFPWASLLSLLNNSSSQKANMVVFSSVRAITWKMLIVKVSNLILSYVFDKMIVSFS